MPSLRAVVMAVLAVVSSALGQRYELWPKGAPGALGDALKDRPYVTVHAPKGAAAPRAAVVVCPGGGYKHLSAIGDYLGLLTANGLVVVHLRYRLPTDGYGHPAPLQDALRAIRMTRANARMWNVDPGRIGVLGFSSGGHVASTVATHHDAQPPPSHRDAVSRMSGRPDFVALFCPVVTMGKHAHKPSVVRLLGKGPSAELLAELSNELQVSKETPPTFLAHAKDDRLVTPENSILLHEALRKSGVPAELHVYPSGGHGFTRASDAWKKDLLVWLRVRKIIS